MASVMGAFWRTGERSEPVRLFGTVAPITPLLKTTELRVIFAPCLDVFLAVREEAKQFDSLTLSSWVFVQRNASKD